MGTWDRKNFGNDNALDFVASFQDGGMAQIENAVKKVVELGVEDYLEAPDCQMALAASEILAFLKGHPSNDFPKELEAETKKIKSTENLKELALIAVKAIDRMKTSSELKELWEESPEHKDWIQVLEDLKKRLNS